MGGFKLALGSVLFAVAVASVLTFAIGRTATAPPVVAAAEPPPPPPPPLPKTDREIGLSVLRQTTEDPKPVMTEKVIPPFIPNVNEAKARPIKDSVVEQKRAESNICTRVNRRKVWVSKFKWRCLK